MPKNTPKSGRKRREVGEEQKYDPKDKFSWNEGDIVFTKKVPQKKTKSLLSFFNKLKEKIQKED